MEEIRETRKPSELLIYHIANMFHQEPSIGNVNQREVVVVLRSSYVFVTDGTAEQFSEGLG